MSEPARPPSTSSTSSTILIIDDSVEMIRLLSAMLKDQGTILFATTGEAGIRIARERRPQLILLDIEMPVMDGYEVCRRLKTDPDSAGASVIFVTANTSMANEVRALDSGAVDFIPKPLNPPVVQARARTQLNLQRQTAALARLADRDGLTGLFNRRYVDGILDKELQRHMRQQLPLGLALIDIDYFKPYNDRYGHQAGDACLARVAQAIADATRRPGEVVGRYGGEEFYVVLPYCSEQTAIQYGTCLCDSVRDLALRHAHSACAPIVTISVGLVAAVPNEHLDAATLIRRADLALYQAKSSGRDQAVIWRAN